MPSAIQKSWAENKLTDTTETGFNFPRHYNTNGSDPGGSDDETQGFWYGSFWMNWGTPSLWVCIDPASGSAVWREIKLS